MAKAIPHYVYDSFNRDIELTKSNLNRINTTLLTYFNTERTPLNYLLDNSTARGTMIRDFPTFAHSLSGICFNGPDTIGVLINRFSGIKDLLSKLKSESKSTFSLFSNYLNSLIRLLSGLNTKVSGIIALISLKEKDIKKLLDDARKFSQLFSKLSQIKEDVLKLIQELQSLFGHISRESRVLQ